MIPVPETRVARRERLVARAAVQRGELARSLVGWRPAAQGADRMLGVLSAAKRLGPLIGLALGLSTLLAARSSRAGRVLRGATSAWQATRSMISAIRSIRA